MGQTHKASRFKHWSRSDAHRFVLTCAQAAVLLPGARSSPGGRRRGHYGERLLAAVSPHRPAAACAKSSLSVPRAFSATRAGARAGFNEERVQSALGISKIQSPEEILKIRVENISWVDWKVIDSGMKLISVDLGLFQT